MGIVHEFVERHALGVTTAVLALFVLIIDLGLVML